LRNFYFPELYKPGDSCWAQALGLAEEQSSVCNGFINELQLLIICKVKLIN